MPKRTQYLLSALLGAAQLAHGTGFFINQQSVRGLGRVNAGVAAAADDASAVFFNPASLGWLWRDGVAADASSVVTVGTQVIIPRSRLSDDGSTIATPGTLGQAVPYVGNDFRDPSRATPIPNLYYARQLADRRAVVGVGIGAPFGLSSRFDESWFGRYDALETSLQTINLGAVAAYAVTPALSIGGGVDIQHARSELVVAVPDPLRPFGPSAATDARNTAKGTAWTPGYNVGVALQLDPGTRLGMSYRSAITHRISGTSTTTGLTGPLAFANGEVDAKARLKLPAMAGVGAWHRASASLALLAQVDWYGWGRFDEIRVVYANSQPDSVRPANYRDAWAASVGAEYALTPGTALRGGLRYDQTPTVDGYRDTTLPDANRLWLGIGASCQLSPRTRVDAAFNHVLFRKASIDVTREYFGGTPLASTVRVRGTADSRVNTLSLNLTHAF